MMTPEELYLYRAERNEQIGVNNPGLLAYVVKCLKQSLAAKWDGINEIEETFKDDVFTPEFCLTLANMLVGWEVFFIDHVAPGTKEQLVTVRVRASNPVPYSMRLRTKK